MDIRHSIQRLLFKKQDLYFRLLQLGIKNCYVCIQGFAYVYVFSIVKHNIKCVQLLQVSPMLQEGFVTNILLSDGTSVPVNKKCGLNTRFLIESYENGKVVCSVI